MAKPVQIRPDYTTLIKASKIFLTSIQIWAPSIVNWTCQEVTRCTSFAMTLHVLDTNSTTALWEKHHSTFVTEAQTIVVMCVVHYFSCILQVYYLYVRTYVWWTFYWRIPYKAYVHELYLFEELLNEAYLITLLLGYIYLWNYLMKPILLFSCEYIWCTV